MLEYELLPNNRRLVRLDQRLVQTAHKLVE